jgi:hypothetical protein
MKLSSIENVINEIAKLPNEWHKAGSVSVDVLSAIARHVDGKEILHSAETGSGKTTLLFSHISQDHKVFAVDDGTDSISFVRSSPIFNPETVGYIEGATQLTLPRYEFKHKLQLVLLDGPHGYPFPDMEYWYFYPHIEEDGLLIVDDIQIPTIYNLYNFLREDEMFELVDVVATTAFFRRTDAPMFELYGDGWWLQDYNKQLHPVEILPDRELGRKVPINVNERIELAAIRQEQQRLHQQMQQITQAVKALPWQPLVQKQESLNQQLRQQQQAFNQQLRDQQQSLDHQMQQLIQQVTSPWQRIKAWVPVSVKLRIKRALGKA